MHALGIPEGQIGTSDHAHGIEWRTFFPHEMAGGNVTVVGRINVDSGVLNPALLEEQYGAEACKIWSKSRLRDRIDAIIVHEEAEHRKGSHSGALESAPATDRPVSGGTRRILSAMKSGWRHLR